MHKYNLNHLIQPKNQLVIGPIQDDEALLLYAIIRVCMFKNIVEIGGLNGYSAINFLSAIDNLGKLFTIDLNFVPKQADNHFIIQKDISEVSINDLLETKIDMLFFDCHVYDAQMVFYKNMLENGLIHDKTVIALHDTGLHPFKCCDWSYRIDEGWVHQPVERLMVNELVAKYNYHAINLHTDLTRHSEDLPLRHGLTILSKFKTLPT